MSDIAMLGKQKPDIANVKKRLDSVFGSYNKFTELINSRTGLSSSIYGVPSSTSFSALGDKNTYPSSNSYSVNTYPSTSHNKSIILKKNIESFGSLSNNDYSKTNIVRPPTKEVLQSMQGLIKDDLLKNLDFSTDICVAPDNSTPSTSKVSEKISKCLTPTVNNENDRKRNFCDKTENLDAKIKKFKKEVKNSSSKYSNNKSKVEKLNRDVQIELFGDFVSDDEENYCEEKEVKHKTNIIPSLALTTAFSLVPQHRISPPPQPPVLSLSKLEKDKNNIYKTLTKTSDKNSVLPHKENSIVKNNDSNSPRLILRIPRPAIETVATETSSLRSFNGVDNHPNQKDKKEKKKKKDKDYKSKKTEKENKSPSVIEKTKKEKESIKNYSTSSKINDSIKSTNTIKPNAGCTASPESNDLHSPDSGFVDMISNGTSFGLSSAAVSKSNNVRGSYDTRTDIETIMENLGRVSPFLSPIRSLSPFLIEPSTSFITSTKNNAKIESPINMSHDMTKKEKTNQNQNLFLNSNKKSAVVSNDFNQIKNVQKPTVISSKLSCTFNDDSKNLSRDFSCQIKINPSLVKLFALKAKEKSTEREANKCSINLESIDDDLIERADSFESELLEKQAIFDQRIKIKEEIIQSHEILIAEQRTQLKNFEKKTKMYTKELENRNKKILSYKNENEQLLKSNVLLTDKANRLAKEVERLSNEMDVLKKRQKQCRN